MAEEVVIAVISGLILAVMGWLVGLFEAPRKVKQWKVHVRRAGKDYSVWRERVDRELADEYRRIDGDHNARGTYNSGIRLQDRRRAEEAVEREKADHLTTLSRAVDDAFGALRRVDKVWMVWTMKDTRKGIGLVKGTWKALVGKTASMEADILDPVVRRVRDGEGPPE